MPPSITRRKPYGLRGMGGGSSSSRHDRLRTDCRDPFAFADAAGRPPELECLVLCCVVCVLLGPEIETLNPILAASYLPMNRNPITGGRPGACWRVHSSSSSAIVAAPSIT